MTRLFLATLLASAALVDVALAQSEDSSGLDEVIITAQRRKQSAQTTGIAVSVLKGQELIDKGAAKVNALQYLTPNLEITPQFGSGQASFSIRGIGFRDYATNNSSTVGVYLDETALSFPVLTQGALFDIERAEVLRGPQGTLYGRNTTGGAINLISNKPTDRFTAGLSASYGSYNAFEAEGYVSGPLSAKVKARLAATTAQGGAWQYNRETGVKLGDADRTAVRGLFEIDPSDRLSLLVNLHYTHDQSDGLGLQLFRDSPFVGPASVHLGQRQTSWGASPSFALLNGIATNTKPFRDNEGAGGSLTANLDIAATRLTYIGSYEYFDRREYNDYDAVTPGGAGVLFDSLIHVFSNELRLSSQNDNKFHWIAGLYQSSEKLDEVYNSDFETTFGPIFAGIFSPPAGTPFAVKTPYSQEANTYAVFGQAEYQVTEQINLVGGLRFEYEQRKLKDLGTFIPFTPTNFATGTTELADRAFNSDQVSGKVAVEYTPAKDVLLYASISRGVKSGGFTAYNTLNPRGIDPFKPEELWAYEIGFKSDLADRTLRLNGAAFYYDYKNQQVQSAIFDPVSGAVVGKIVNAPKTRVYGAELELLWQPVKALQFRQAVGYTRGEFEKFTDLDTTAPPATLDRAGQSLGVPAFSYTGGVSYQAPIFTGLSLRGALDYSFRDKASFPLLGPLYNLKSYWLVNGLIGVGAENGSWELSLWGRNLLNERYDLTRNSFLVGFSNDISAPGEPRTYGLRLSLKY